mmetsp:Transcript_14696/g.29262  ORF Transcript_14696/g.29262 Transcript_14696/m.29262 type:complete len:137 (+) Transcript_14696:99-509(+)
MSSNGPPVADTDDDLNDEEGALPLPGLGDDDDDDDARPQPLSTPARPEYEATRRVEAAALNSLDVRAVVKPSRDASYDDRRGRYSRSLRRRPISVRGRYRVRTAEDFNMSWRNVAVRNVRKRRGKSTSSRMGRVSQ